MTGPSSRALWQPAMHSSGLRRLGLACRAQSDTPTGNPSLLQTRLLEALRRTCVELYLFSRTAAQMRDGPARPQTLIARARYALQHIMHLLELQYIAQSSHCT